MLMNQSPFKLTKINNLPTFDDLVNDPSRANAFSSEEAIDMLGQLMAIQAILMVQAVSVNKNEHQKIVDRLLKVEEVACRLNCEPDWLYQMLYLCLI